MDGADGEDESEEAIENIKLFVFHTGMKQGQIVHKQRYRQKESEIEKMKERKVSIDTGHGCLVHKESKRELKILMFFVSYDFFLQSSIYEYKAKNL